MVYWSRRLTQEIAVESGEGMGWEKPGQGALYEASYLCGHLERNPPGNFGKQHVVHLRVIPAEQGDQSITPWGVHSCYFQLSSRGSPQQPLRSVLEQKQVLAFRS